MADNIYQNQDGVDQFVGRKAAWHLKGTLEDVSAPEAYAQIGGVQLIKQPVFWANAQTTEQYGIARVDNGLEPAFSEDLVGALESFSKNLSSVAVTDGDRAAAERLQEQFRLMIETDRAGVQWHPIRMTVSENWNLITHDEFANVWHEEVTGTVSSLFLLGDGGKMVICDNLRKSELNGDETQWYIFGVNDNSGGSNVMGVSPVRVVCQNTLMAAVSRAEALFRVNHNNPDILTDLRTWMRDVAGTANDRADEMQAAFTRLVNGELNDEQIEKAVTVAIPGRGRPKTTASKTHDDKNYTQWERDMETVMRHRDELTKVIMEGPTGFDQSDPMSPWRVFNGAAEYEQHLRKTKARAGVTIDEARLERAVFGTNAQRNMRNLHKHLVKSLPQYN